MKPSKRIVVLSSAEYGLAVHSHAERAWCREESQERIGNRKSPPGMN